MGAFDGKNKIKRAVVDPQTDHKLPKSFSLSWKAITTPAALAGTTGTHCELVYGDKWRQIVGNVTENVTENSATTITGDHSHNVIGNQNLSVLKNAIDTHLGPCTKTYVDNKIESYSKHRFTSMSSNSDFSYIDQQFAAFGFQLQVFVVQVQIFGVVINIVTNPLVAAAGAAAVASQADTHTVVAPGYWTAAGVVGFMGFEYINGLSITLNTGLSLSIDVEHLESNLFFKGDEKLSLAQNFAALDAHIWAAMAGVGGAKAAVAPGANAVPGPPLCLCGG